MCIKEEFGVSHHTVSVVEHGGNSGILTSILVNRNISFQCAPSDDKVMAVMEEPITYSPLHLFVGWNYLKALHSFEFEKWDECDFAIKPMSTWVFETFIWGSITVSVNSVMLSVANTDVSERMSRTADTRNQFLCLSI